MITPSLLVMISTTAGVMLLVVGIGRHTAAARLNRRLSRTLHIADGPALRSRGWARAAEAALAVGSKDRQEIHLALRQANFTNPNTFGWFVICRMAAALVFGGISALATRHIHMSATAHFIFVFGAFAIAFIISKRILRVFANHRLHEVRKELPFLIDMLVLMLESGVSLDQALRQFSQTTMSSMEHTRRATAGLVDDLQKGMGYDQALGRWADRLAAPSVRDLAALIAQSMAHGTELGPTLRNYSHELAERRLMSAREAVGRKSGQMTVVMVVCLMPVVLIILAGPAVVTINHLFIEARH